MSAYQMLRPADCCLHIIDPQTSLMKQIHEAGNVTRVIKFMIQCAQVLHLPILANTQYKKGLGPYVDELEDMMDGIVRHDKVEFGAYGNSGTVEAFQALSPEITTVVLVGVESHICIYQTAVGVLQMGRTPYIVADGVSSRSPINHELGLRRLEAQGAIIGSAEMLIYELLGKAGTEEFKALLPHIVAFNDNNE